MPWDKNLHEVEVEIEVPTSFNGTNTVKLEMTEDNLKSVYDAIGEKLLAIEQEKLDKTPMCRLAKTMVWQASGSFMDETIDEHWAKVDEERKQLALRRANYLIQDGWTHSDDIADATEDDIRNNAASWLENVKFGDLADVMSGIGGTRAFQYLSPIEKDRTMAVKVLQWLTQEAKK
jgi:hypothetical protein